MKHIIRGVLFTFYCGVVIASAQVKSKVDMAASVFSTAHRSASSRERALKAYGTLPLSFEVNMGQTADSVRFLTRGDGYMLFLTPTGLVLTLPDKVDGADRLQNPNLRSSAGRENVLRMELEGARPDTQVEGTDELPGKSNYFIGNDPKKWHVGVPTFRRVKYNSPYPGINLAYYGNKRELEYDFVVGPGSDPNLIRLKIEGARNIEVEKNGNVLIRVGGRTLRLTAPNVYQDQLNRRSPVEAKWLLSNRGELTFGLGVYDHKKALVIDPSVVPPSTYLGGSGTDSGSSVALDSSGNAYIAGYTNSTNFPQGDHQGVYPTYQAGNGQHNAFIAEIDPAGSTLIYSTYLGGNNGDTANGIAVDTSGDAYVVGTTFSGDFPGNINAFQSTCAGGCKDGDAFVTELAPLGGSVVFSSFLGGTGHEQGNGIALGQGLVYVVGWTDSTNFTTTVNAHQGTNAGGDDAFFAKISPPSVAGSELIYSTYLGGSLTDVASAITVDGSGNSYIVGYTTSANFPTVNPEQTSCGGCANGFSAAFVTEFNSNDSINYSTFLSGSVYPNGNSADVPCGQTTGTAADQACGVAVDSSGNVYVAGGTTSTNFPTVNAYQSRCASSCSSSDAFVTKLNSSGSSITYSTYLGGNGDDRANAIALDGVGNAFVTGQTTSTDFPDVNSEFDAYHSCTACANSGRDAFIAEFNVPGNALIYFSYLGGTTTQSGLGIAISLSEQAIVAGSTKSSDFPTTSGAFQTAFGGIEDAFLTEYPEAVNCSISTTGSGLTVNASLTCFGNFVAGTDNQEILGFFWGDGNRTGSGSGCPSPCTTAAGSATFPASHTYGSAGTYLITPSVHSQTNGFFVTTGFAVNVTVPVVSVTTTALAAGQVGTPYSQQVSAANGAPPYTWSITSGALPTGLILTAATGTIAGTPTTAGTSTFTIQVKDSNGTTANQSLSISITSPALVITTTSLAPDVVGVPYTQTLAASGGKTPYSWSLSAGSLPAGMTLTASTGVIAGTPTIIGTSSFTVQVQDAAGNTATKALSIVVNPPPVQLSVLTTTLPGGTIDVAYPSTNLQASGGTPPYTWSVSTGTLPVGMSLNAQGAISGSPTTGGTFNFTVQVADSTGETATEPLSIGITAPQGAPTCPLPSVNGSSSSNPLMVSASSNCSDSAGTIASTSINWGDGTAPLSGSNGSHTYGSAGAYTITVTATDTNNLSATATVSITVSTAVATAVPQGSALPAQTSNVTAPIGVPSVQVTYTCTSANGPSGTQSLSSYGLTCAISPAQVTLTSAPTSVTISLSTTGHTATLGSGSRNGGAGWLYAAIFPIPGIALLGIGSFKRRQHFKRYAGVAMLSFMLWAWLGCGGSTPTLSSTTVTQPTPTGSYSVNVIGTDSSGNQQSVITVGFSVTGG